MAEIINFPRPEQANLETKVKKAGQIIQFSPYYYARLAEENQRETEKRYGLGPLEEDNPTSMSDIFHARDLAKQYGKEKILLRNAYGSDTLNPKQMDFEYSFMKCNLITREDLRENPDAILEFIRRYNSTHPAQVAVFDVYFPSRQELTRYSMSGNNR